VVPEALAKNELVLPVGAECDRCNSYLGDIDGILAKHPLVSLAAQLLNLPGKRGHARKMIGTAARRPEAKAIAVPVRARKRVTAEGDVWNTTLLVDPAFDDYRFRRALHHLALNAVASTRGVDAALDSRFNNVRRYVREPLKIERWGYGELPLNGASSDILIMLIPDDAMEGVGMRLLGAVFYVDLLNSGHLQAWLDRERHTVPGLRYWDASHRILPGQKWDGKREYELLIDYD
jgi:hypothetical protein